MKVLILQGIPACGKSTLAKQLVRGEMAYTFVYGQGQWKRVNKDDFRKQFDESIWSEQNEKFLLAVRNYTIERALKDGLNVVVDDTNLNPRHIHDIGIIADEYGAEVQFKFFPIELEEAIKRDAAREAKGEATVGAKVVKKIHSQLKDGLPRLSSWTPYEVRPYVKPEGKPEAIIVDIDGTLAHTTGRSPYDNSLVHTDTVDKIVLELVQKEHSLGTTVIVLSGRKDDCRDVTDKWLRDKGVEFEHLYMRDYRDDRNDAIVKNELFDKYVRDNYRIKYVLDDRNRVVKRWRALGLKTLQVEDGDF